MRYGLPYKGSKNLIAKKIIGALPEADMLYDIFAGGCAVTHCAMLSGKYKHFVINDIQADIIRLFSDALNGKYKNEKRWISREDFFALKDSDPYVKYCWSFGNNGCNYLYGKYIEEYKRDFHFACFSKKFEPMRKYFPDFPKEFNGTTSQEIRLEIGKWITEWGKLNGQSKNGHVYFYVDDVNGSIRIGNANELQSLESLERLQSLQRLERLQSLQRLEGLQNLEVLNTSYENIEFPQNCVIYCDIPYIGTDCGSYSGFDHYKFYDWALKTGKKHRIFISEYYMPDDFKLVASFPKRQLSSSKGAGKLVSENLYTV